MQRSILSGMVRPPEGSLRHQQKARTKPIRLVFDVSGLFDVTLLCDLAPKV